MDMHHEPHGEQRRRQIDYRNRDEGRDQKSGDINGPGVAFAYCRDLAGRPKAERCQIKIYAAQQPRRREKEYDRAEAHEYQERRRANVHQNREQSRPAALDKRAP